jgi:hypothetical protein
VKENPFFGKDMSGEPQVLTWKWGIVQGRQQGCSYGQPGHVGYACSCVMVREEFRWWLQGWDEESLKVVSTGNWGDSRLVGGESEGMLYWRTVSL